MGRVPASGSTGAGVKPQASTLFSWRNDNISIYKPFGHQHLPEIIQSIKQLQPDYDGEIAFIPYRGGFARGIFATLVVKCDLDIETLFDSVLDLGLRCGLGNLEYILVHVIARSSHQTGSSFGNVRCNEDFVKFTH